MRKVRIVKDKPIPEDGKLEKGEVMLAPLTNRIVMYVKIRVRTFRIIGESIRARQETTKEILFNGQSWAKKWARLRADALLDGTERLYSPATFRQLGFEVGQCVCGPGVGHNAPRREKRKKGRRRKK